MKPNRWPYRKKKEADRGLSTSNIERIAKALGSAIHDTLSSRQKERLSFGDSSVEFNSDGIKISTNSILLDNSTKSERR